ncbi:MAG: replication initiation protein, partial [Hyphomicrobiales bacterium]
PPTVGTTPPASPPAPALSEADRLRRIRELWENDRTGQARAVFAEMLEPAQAEVRSRFEAERLEQVAVPIARAWRRDGPSSRIAATTFFKWLAQETWPEEPTDRVLLDFALQRGVAGV